MEFGVSVALMIFGVADKIQKSLEELLNTFQGSEGKLYIMRVQNQRGKRDFAGKLQPTETFF